MPPARKSCPGERKTIKRFVFAGIVRVSMARVRCRLIAPLKRAKNDLWDKSNSPMQAGGLIDRELQVRVR